MAVPGHDERDFEFATLFHLPIVEVITHPDSPKDANGQLTAAYIGPGHMLNSRQFNGLPSDVGKERVVAWLGEWEGRKNCQLSHAGLDLFAPALLG